MDINKYNKSLGFTLCFHCFRYHKFTQTWREHHLFLQFPSFPDSHSSIIPIVDVIWCCKRHHFQQRLASQTLSWRFAHFRSPSQCTFGHFPDLSLCRLLYFSEKELPQKAQDLVELRTQYHNTKYLFLQDHKLQSPKLGLVLILWRKYRLYWNCHNPKADLTWKYSNESACKRIFCRYLSCLGCCEYCFSHLDLWCWNTSLHDRISSKSTTNTNKASNC